MLKEIETTDPAEIQALIERHKYGTGPLILGQFLGKGSTDLVAVRWNGKYLEGRYAGCHEDEWYRITRVFYEDSTYVKEPQSKQLFRQLAQHTDLIATDQEQIHNYIHQLETLLEEYRTLLISTNFPLPEEDRYKRLLLEQTYALIGSHLPNGTVQNGESDLNR